jgi:hypothetical protein
VRIGVDSAGMGPVHDEKRPTMAHSSSYAAISDGEIDLEFGADVDHTFSFDAPGVAADLQSVLSFVTNPTLDGKNNDVNVQLSLNGTDVLDLQFTSDPARAWQEIVQGGLLKEKDNKLTAKLTDSDKAGAISLKDIVLYYKLA